MTKQQRTFSQTMLIPLAFSALTLMSGSAHSAGHFISGLQGKYPAYDLNDAYVFQSSNEGYTTFISSSNPSAPGSSVPISGVIFDDAGLYNLHISDDENFKKGRTLVFSFNQGNVSVHVIGAPNAAVGEKGELLVNGKVGETITVPNGMRIWTGRGKDAFFGNGAGLAEFNAARQKGEFSPKIFMNSGDLFANGSTASFIVVDIPNKMLGDEISFFTTTAVEHKGEWSQVSCLANVLFPYVFLSDTPAVQEDHEQHRPDLDVKERHQAIVNNVFWSVSVAGSQKGQEKQYAHKIADTIMPDVIRYQPGTEASYTVGKLNGRALGDDAMNTVLELFNGVAIDDNANDEQRYTKQFPYILPVQ